MDGRVRAVVEDMYHTARTHRANQELVLAELLTTWADRLHRAVTEDRAVRFNSETTVARLIRDELARMSASG